MPLSRTPTLSYKVKGRGFTTIGGQNSRSTARLEGSIVATIGRLILVKAVLTAIPIHVLIAIYAPRWIIKSIDKIRRGFLWSGKRNAQGGNCPVSWERVTRPIQLGGLGLHNLELLGHALKMRWLWIRPTEPQATTAHIEPQLSIKAKALFEACVMTRLGNGRAALFWVDKWLDGRSVRDIAPSIMAFVRKRGWRRRTVCEALDNNTWTEDIVGGLPVPALWEFL